MKQMMRIEDVLAEQGIFASTAAGWSMYPMLRDRRDTIIISPCPGRLKKYDVPLYKRDNHYILHRVVKTLPKSYVIRGDNCVRMEYGITDDEIIGVLTGFYRDGKQVNMNGLTYRSYVRLWCVLYPVRCLYKNIRIRAGRQFKHSRKEK